jgi:beta-lactamase superfamily II metal-dependent hydrolase
MINCNTTTQGDCHLLEDNGVYTLVDAGQPKIAEERLIPYLASRQIDEIEHFFISHPHTDHYGGLESLKAAGIRVNNIYYNALPPGVSDFNYKPIVFSSLLSELKSNGAKLHNVRSGFSLELPSTKIHVIVAEKALQSSVNDYSLIMTWDAGGYRTLFTGDLDAKLGTKLANDPRVAADILKVPHHGVTGIAPNEFFDKVNPSLILIPGHKNLWYDRRGAQVRNWSAENWAKNNTHICNNAFNGDVRILFYENAIELDPQKRTTTCPKKNWALEPKVKPRLSPIRMNLSPTITLLLED